MRTAQLKTVLAVGVTAVIGLTACGSSGSKSSSTTAAPAAATTAAPAPAGPTVNISVGETSDTAMFLKADATTVKAGKVTFVVTNNGKKDHEAVVLTLKSGETYDTLAIDPATNRVSEDGNVGETGDPALKPGETRTFTADLTAGDYALVCNIEKHYGMGMRAPFTVTP